MRVLGPLPSRKTTRHEPTGRRTPWTRTKPEFLIRSDLACVSAWAHTLPNPKAIAAGGRALDGDGGCSIGSKLRSIPPAKTESPRLPGQGGPGPPALLSASVWTGSLRRPPCVVDPWNGIRRKFGVWCLPFAHGQARGTGHVVNKSDPTAGASLGPGDGNSALVSRSSLHVEKCSPAKIWSIFGRVKRM